MTKIDFKKEILNKIEKYKIEPKARWQFLLKDYFLWIVGFISVVVGGLFASVVIFDLYNSDWEVYRLLNKSFLRFIPFLWIVVFAIFVFVADYNFKNTKKGYRYGLLKVVLASAICSVALGFVFYWAGLSHVTDDFLGKRVPGYIGVIERKEMMLNHSDDGFLVGEFIPSERSDALIFQDLDGKIWEVDPTYLSDIDFVVIDKFGKVNLIGRKTGEGTFLVCGVRPWKIKNGLMLLEERVENPLLDFDENEIERNFFEMRNKKCGQGTTTMPVPFLRNLGD